MLRAVSELVGREANHAAKDFAEMALVDKPRSCAHLDHSQKGGSHRWNRDPLGFLLAAHDQGVRIIDDRPAAQPPLAAFKRDFEQRSAVDRLPDANMARR